VSDEPILRVRGLKTCFRSDGEEIRAVDGIDFEVYRKETLALVGESGCGKSASALSIMGLLPRPQGRIAGGEILYGGVDLARLAEEDLRRLRGNEISMIFQEPMTSLNPVYTVGRQIVEAVTAHRAMSKKKARNRAVEMLRRVGIPDPEGRVRSYPHEMSGGMRQRVMIAMALACTPRLLIADEPTTALDVTIQAQILSLLKELQADIGMSILLITHDLGVVAETADRVAVMYAGRIVEYATALDLFARPLHPYTRGLLESIPRIDLETERLHAIPGTVPAGRDLPPGCRFSNRCPKADDACTRDLPPLIEVSAGHWVGCRRLERP
jgi:oligopeptide/dipeptide ABC transporter ATP-binding protein